MKILVTEQQYGLIVEQGKVELARQQFKVLDDKVYDDLVKKIKKSKDKQSYTEIENSILIKKIDWTNPDTNESGTNFKLEAVRNSLFLKMVEADPTENKQYLLWIMSLMKNLIAHKDFAELQRFASEDLPQATDAILIFDKHTNPRNPEFSRQTNQDFLGLKIPKDINIKNYQSIPSLVKAVGALKPKADESNIASEIRKYIEMGEMEKLYEDSKWTVVAPLTNKASCGVFEEHASWCTRRSGNTYFDSYTNQLQPNKEKSKLYVIMDKNFIQNGDNSNLYQIHFESNQHNDANNHNIEWIEFLDANEGLKGFFTNELMKLVSKSKSFNLSDKYVKELIEITKSVDTVIKHIDPSVEKLDFSGMRITHLPPEITKFTKLKELVLKNCELTALPDNIGDLTELEAILAPGNDISVIPASIGNLKHLEFINLMGSNIKTIPNSLKQLDGGELMVINVGSSLDDKMRKKLQTLLPNVDIN